MEFSTLKGDQKKLSIIFNDNFENIIKSHALKG